MDFPPLIGHMKTVFDDITRLSYLGQAVAALLFTEKAAEVAAFLESEEMKASLGSEEFEVTAEFVPSVSEDGRISFTFGEKDFSENAVKRTCISFDPASPKLIMVTRDGEVPSVLVMEEGRRHLCAYQTPYMPFDLVTYTVSVDNRLSEKGGTLEMDYYIDIQGSTAQRVRLSLEIRPEEATSGEQEETA
ncbi:MAG: DUF1934 domain-containing protein [Clostridia bacterium]|nr:DUF1934 domain-containing protein [Clostridia bacterium]